eukprot:1591124-Prymnesium_polylepis.1
MGAHIRPERQEQSYASHVPFHQRRAAQLQTLPPPHVQKPLPQKSVACRGHLRLAQIESSLLMTFLVLYCRVLTALTALMALLARIWTIVVTEVLSWRACENFQVSAATSVFAMSCLRIDPTFFSK